MHALKTTPKDCWLLLDRCFWVNTPLQLKDSSDQQITYRLSSIVYRLSSIVYPLSLARDEEPGSLALRQLLSGVCKRHALQVVGRQIDHQL